MRMVKKQVVTFKAFRGERYLKIETQSVIIMYK